MTPHPMIRWAGAALAMLAIGSAAAQDTRPDTRAAPMATPPAPTRQALAWIDGLGPSVKLVLADDFDGTTLERGKWCTRFQHAGGPPLQVPDPACTRPKEYGTLDWLNDEQQRYVDTNKQGQSVHRVGGGILQLMATQTLPGPHVLFEAGMIRSKLEFRAERNKGYVFLARVRLPAVRGSWPAFWISPGVEDDGRTAWPPEIDFMEGALNASSDKEHQISMGSRPQNWGGKGMSQTPVPLTYTGPGFDRMTKRYARAASLRGVWLELAAHWTETGVCYYVDRQKVACEEYRWLDNERTLAPAGPVMLNLAVGGVWAGADGIDLKGFPTSFDIDHVRVYEVSGR